MSNQKIILYFYDAKQLRPTGKLQPKADLLGDLSAFQVSNR